MLIGELAARFGLATHVLRHWEDVGLLTPSERVNGRRRYSQHHVTRVAMIIRGKAGGLSLEQLRDVFDASTGADRRALLRRHHTELESRIRELAASKQLVEHALECRAEDFTRCPAFVRMTQDLDRRSRAATDG